MDLVLASGEVRPSAGVSLTYETAGEAGLGYVPAQDARGILDEQNKSFSTVHFDIGKTLDQEPEGGWEPVFDPHELAVTLAGTVITLEETSGVTVELRGLNSVVGADPTTRPFRWRRALQ